MDLIGFQYEISENKSTLIWLNFESREITWTS